MKTLPASIEKALAAVTDELAGARLDPESVLRTALGTLSKLRAGTWVATVMSKDPRSMTVVAANGDEPQLGTYVEGMYPAGAAPTLSFSQTVIETGEPVLVPQVSFHEFLAMQITEVSEYLVRHEPPTQPIARIGFMMVPLRTRESTIGSLGLFDHREPEPLTEHDVNWLQTIADRVAIAVENGQMRVAGKTRLLRLTAFHSVAMAIAGSRDLRLTLQVILDQGVSALEADAADLLVHDEADDMLRMVASTGFQATSIPEYRLPVQEVLPGKLLVGQAGTSEFSPAEGRRRTLFAREGFRSRRAVPLFAQGKMTGVIEVFSRSELQPDQEWLDFLEALTSAAAVAIDRASMIERFEKSTPRSIVKPRVAAPDFSRLESQILVWLVEGLPNAAIAEQVHLSQHTIKFHVRRIMQKVGVVNRTELARKATKEGWL